MNKLTNTYLDAVDSLLAIHLKNPHPEHWHQIISHLSSAVRELNEEPDGKTLMSDGKRLSFRDLKRTVDAQVASEVVASDFPWCIGDFEIRRRK